jgi:hypothetical protein
MFWMLSNEVLDRSSQLPRSASERGEMKLGTNLGENIFVRVNSRQFKLRISFGFLVFLCLAVPSAVWGQSDYSLKPAKSEAIQFVSRTGNDTNDGLSWSSAKLTIHAAYQTLPSKGCNFGPHCGGIIYLGDGITWGGPVSGQGLRILGAHDPNFASPPPGWIKERAVKFKCESNGSWDATAAVPMCYVSGNSTTQPGLWISGNTAPMEFDGIKILSGSGSVLGRDSNGVFENNAGVSNLTFRDCAFGGTYSVTTNGPGLRIGPNSFENYFYTSVFDGNPNAKGGTEARQGLVSDAGGAANSNSGQLYLMDSHINSGGFESNPTGTGSTGAVVSNLICEGQTDGHGCVWIRTTTTNSFYTLSQIWVADDFPANASVEVDGNGPPDAVTVIGAGGGVTGPVMFMGFAPVGINSMVVSANRQHETGFLNGHVLGQTDAARRGFSPSAVRFTNLANTAPAGWTVTVSSIVTTQITAPDGTTGAATCSSSSGSGNCYFYNAKQTYAVGDIVVLGVWARPRNSGGFSGSAVLGFSTPFCGSCAFADISGNSTGNFVSQYIKGDGSSGNPPAEWEWYWKVLKVSTTSDGPSQTQFLAPVHAKLPADYYAPVFLHVPAGAISDNEATELALNLQSYGSSCVVGSICGLPGQTEAPAHLGQMAANQFAGTAKLSNGTVTVTFPTPYQKTPICVASDTTSELNGIKPTPAATKVVFAGAGMDSIAYICVGNPN